MTTAQYQTLTAGKGRAGSKVSKVDKLLTKYEGLRSSDADLGERLTTLQSIKTLADAYVGTKGGGLRTAGVSQLVAEVNDELAFIDPLLDALGLIASDPVRSFERTVDAQDAYRAAERAGRPLPANQQPNFGDLISRARNSMNSKGGTVRSAGMKAIITKDLTRLTQMSTDSKVDPLMRSILVEVLGNVGQTYFQETGGMASGAVLAGPKDRSRGITEKYRVDVAMEQGEGSAERMSSIVHELTHVATQEAFANTPIHLAFENGADDGVILKLSQKRTKDVADLETALDAPGTHWTESQRGVLISKIKYPVQGKNTLGSYAVSFRNKGELTDSERDRILGLEARGANNTLIEFDTVVNQMMFLMTAWSVRADDPFYVVLKRVAQEAYDYRNT
jgi:hypothetical protein